MPALEVRADNTTSLPMFPASYISVRAFQPPTAIIYLSLIDGPLGLKLTFPIQAEAQKYQVCTLG